MPTNRANWTHPDLKALAGLFFEDCSELGQFTELPPESLPTPYRELLGHTLHMTVTLERHHVSPVDVIVVDKKITDSHYARKSLLRRQSDETIVQFGIVRLAKPLLATDVREEIEGESIPLGRVLIDHNVMRNVKLMSTWKIIPGPALQEAFAPTEVEECYGRTALIYTDGVPAVELLEIVVDV